MAVSMYVCEDMMETRQITLTDFLLARIEVEETGTVRAYRDLAEALRNQRMVTVADWLTDQGARVLAECEAKRRIVAWCSERDRVYIGTLATDIPREKDFVPGALVHQTDAITLRFLALPYADHPDYRQEWKP